MRVRRRIPASESIHWILGRNRLKQVALRRGAVGGAIPSETARTQRWRGVRGRGVQFIGLLPSRPAIDCLTQSGITAATRCFGPVTCAGGTETLSGIPAAAGTAIRLPRLCEELKKGRALRVLRGGSWNNNPNNLRASYRNRNTPDNRNNNNGFRPVRTLHQARSARCESRGRVGESPVLPPRAPKSFGVPNSEREAAAGRRKAERRRFFPIAGRLPPPGAQWPVVKRQALGVDPSHP